MADPAERLARVHEFGEHGGVNGSVEISTTFTVLAANTLPAIFQGQVGPEGGCYVYGRSFNPTVRALAKQLAALEDTEAAYATSSGMAAISSTLFALCQAGAHIVASNTVYGGTFALLKSFLPEKCGITTTFVDITDTAAVAAAMRPNTKVVYTEAISNPTLVVAPLDALAGIAHGRGAQLVVDNTFTPCIITPKHWGADVVIHSMTKFISGASDIIAGVVCGTAAFIDALMDFHTGPLMLLGPTMDPRIAGELQLRLPHLALRMVEHSRRAQALAERLHVLGAPVTYPGLPSHPQHKLMARLSNPGYGYGGLLGLDLGTKAAADAFMERLQNKHGFGYMAVSLGYFDTLMSASAASTSSELTPGELATSGIRPGYVRMSIGLTGSLEQRWTQLQEAWAFIEKGGATAPYRAIKVTARAEAAAASAGELLSWPSLGSETALDLIPEPAPDGTGTGAAPQAESYVPANTNSPAARLSPVSSIGSLTADGTTPSPSRDDARSPTPRQTRHPLSTAAAATVAVAGVSTRGSPQRRHGDGSMVAAGLAARIAGSITEQHGAAKVKVRRLADGVDIIYEPVAPRTTPAP